MSINNSKYIEMDFRIDEYDVAKGLGMLLVILGHILGVASKGGVFVYSFHIPLFFILSGIVMKPIDNLSFKNILRKQRTLIFNYSFWSIIYIGFDIIVRILILNQDGFRLIYRDIYMAIVLYGINVLWFLSTLILSKIMFYVIIKLIKAKSKRLMFACLNYIFTAIVSIVIREVLVNCLLIYYIAVSFLRAQLSVSFIILGFTFSKNIKYMLKNLKSIHFIILSVGLFLYIYIMSQLMYKNDYIIDFHELIVGNPIIVLMTSICGFTLIISISAMLCRLNIFKNLFLELGINSLFVMVTHEYLKIRELTEKVCEIVVPRSNTTIFASISLVNIILIEIILIHTCRPFLSKLENCYVRNLSKLLHL